MICLNLKGSKKMNKILFGIFTENLKIFGIIIILLLIIIIIIIRIVIKNLIKKSNEFDELHDDLITVKMQDEGRKSFTNTLLEIKIKVDNHEKRLDRIDDRCEKRLKKELTIYRDSEK
jgi:hypothetical protein